MTYLEKNKAEVAGLGNFYNIVADLEKGHKELFKARPKVTWYHKLTTPKVSYVALQISSESDLLQHDILQNVQLRNDLKEN